MVSLRIPCFFLLDESPATMRLKGMKTLNKRWQCSKRIPDYKPFDLGEKRFPR
jgi:hypothetical protein